MQIGDESYIHYYDNVNKKVTRISTKVKSEFADGAVEI